VLTALISASLACAGSTESVLPVSYRATAQENYDRGVKELADENFTEATKYFTFVKSKFGFSKYSTLAELRLADTHFRAGRYPEAIDGYKTFARLHPTHEEVASGYCEFRVVQGHVKQMPTDWLLAPPSYEKDQTPAREALREVEAFVERYPDSRYLGEAHQLQTDIARELTRHELYVARFYLDRGNPKGAVFRMVGLRQRYPEAAYDAEVLWLLAQAYLKLQRWTDTKVVLAELVRRHPADPRAADGRSLLRRLGVEPAGSPSAPTSQRHP
jgi:outer membrane protein assembly factor BamD